MQPTYKRGVPEVSASEIFPCIGSLRIIDVRRSDEFWGELGHIEGAQLLTLGNEFDAWLAAEGNREKETLFVCRSGARSEVATLMAMKIGFKHVANLKGGMLDWVAQGLPVSAKST
jgi:hydroxyacylglutathione hydrolase